MSFRPCPVCGESRVEPVHNQRFVLFDGHYLSGDCDTVVCLRCGMTFNRATSPERAYDAYYASLS